jgi:hypothetical protein
MIAVITTGNIRRTLIEGLDYTVVDGVFKLTNSLKDELTMSDSFSITYEEPVKPAEPEIQKQIILGTKLSVENQNYILGDLFGFSVDITGVIYDDEGDEFYGYNANLVYDLSTLAGIIKYAQATSFKKGANDIIYKLNKLLIPQ